MEYPLLVYCRYVPSRGVTLIGNTRVVNRCGDQVRALGALLTHLQSTVFGLETSGSVVVTTVRQLDASSSMRIDAMTLR